MRYRFRFLLAALVTLTAIVLQAGHARASGDPTAGTVHAGPVSGGTAPQDETVRALPLDLGLRLERVYRSSTEPCDHAWFPYYRDKTIPQLENACLYAAKNNWTILLVTKTCVACDVRTLSVLAIEGGSRTVRSREGASEIASARVAPGSPPSSSTVPTTIGAAPSNQIYNASWLDNYDAGPPGFSGVPGKTFILLQTDVPADACFVVRAVYLRSSVDTKPRC